MLKEYEDEYRLARPPLYVQKALLAIWHPSGARLPGTVPAVQRSGLAGETAVTAAPVRPQLVAVSRREAMKHPLRLRTYRGPRRGARR